MRAPSDFKMVRPEIVAEHEPLSSVDLMPEAGSREAAKYWFDLGSGEAMPDWSDFQLKWIVSLLPLTMVYARSLENADEEPVCLLMGETCRERIGLDMARKRPSELLPKGNAIDVVGRINRCLHIGKPTYVRKRMNWKEQPWMIYSSLFLPFGCERYGTRCLSIMKFEVLPMDPIEEVTPEAPRFSLRSLFNRSN